MSDEESKEEFRFFADRAKSGRSACKKCKQKIDTGTLRMAKTGSNPYGSGMMKLWHHVPCMFEVFSRQRKTTPKIESLDDISGWDALSKEDQEEIMSYLPDSAKVRTSAPPEKKNVVSDKQDVAKKNPAAPKKKRVAESNEVTPSTSAVDTTHKDNSLREFRRLCCDISNVSAYKEKTAIMNSFLTKGTDGNGFKGNLLLTVKLLLPGVIKRIYNIQDRQIVKLFSRLFNAKHEDMLESLEEGDVAETVRIFFESSSALKPSAHSRLTLQEVDSFLEQLSSLTREDDQAAHFAQIIPKCTSNDLKMIIRFVKHDLRINTGAKHVLDAVHPDAYQAFQSSRDIDAVLSQVTGKKNEAKVLKIGIKLLTPILPMLAAPCKSAEEALKKCPNGIFADIKYDGERVQVHKNGSNFKYFSRSLKPVLPHKVQMLEEYIPKAFSSGYDLILDGEILLMDTTTSKPLPFGTLGKHKKTEFKEATVCFFVFDCTYYNGESLIHKPFIERRQILLDNMTEIPHRVVLSEMEEINSKRDLEMLMTRVFREGLEGLVLKDRLSTYAPGKRHWLKIKKDYLADGALADSADLVVLGAWYGTGQKGGMMSVFLMGCYDDENKHWCTVTKVHTGHDDATLKRLQDELKMVKISKDVKRVPSWLRCTSTMVPDFVARNPKESPVWEITGAEFTQHVVHTADGISIRFPRVTKIRTDKNWETATNLYQLKNLYKLSKETSGFSLPGHSASDEPDAPQKELKKLKLTPSLPSKNSTKALTPSSYMIKNPLPDVFVGIKLVTPDDTSNIEDIHRYFIAYGGEVVKEIDTADTDSTFYILDSKTDENFSDQKVFPVTQSWLLRCFSQMALLPLPVVQ